MRSVKAAEQRLVSGQESKSYLGSKAIWSSSTHLWELVAGPQAKVRASAGVQTPGGSGALRLSADLAARLGSRRVHLGLPGWPNHAAIFKTAGLDRHLSLLRYSHPARADRGDAGRLRKGREGRCGAAACQLSQSLRRGAVRCRLDGDCRGGGAARPAADHRHRLSGFSVAVWTRMRPGFAP